MQRAPLHKYRGSDPRPIMDTELLDVKNKPFFVMITGQRFHIIADSFPFSENLSLTFLYKGHRGSCFLGIVQTVIMSFQPGQDGKVGFEAGLAAPRYTQACFKKWCRPVSELSSNDSPAKKLLA